MSRDDGTVFPDDTEKISDSDRAELVVFRDDANVFDDSPSAIGMLARADTFHRTSFSDGPGYVFVTGRIETEVELSFKMSTAREIHSKLGELIETAPKTDAPMCEACVEQGGYEGDPPTRARYLVTVTGPAEAMNANPPQHLCNAHASRMTEAYIGYGWGCNTQLLGAWGHR